ncbi:IS1380 family transposase [bacterium]|nr:IS1380 family transposase [bacterium]
MTLSQGLLSYKIELTPTPLDVTAVGGLPLVIEAMRLLLSKRLYKRLRDALGYRSYKTVQRHLESLVALVVAGGSCIDDLDTLRADPGLHKLLGYTPSSPTQAKEFLYRFHQTEAGGLLPLDADGDLAVKGVASIRPEGPGLRGLGAMVTATVRRLQVLQPRHRATLDVDATIIEAHKRYALKAYEGTVGYQPQMAWWAEQQVWVRDQFRDGNVPAAFQVKDFLQRAFGALPGSVQQRRLRGDSALYDEDALTWADDQGIAFAVSADMSKSLAETVQAIPDGMWKPYRTLRRTEGKEEPPDAEERQWAEAGDFVPDWKRNRRRGSRPFRYIAIRVRSRQRDLLTDDEDRWRHFAVVTNMDWQGERLLRWQREKQGTVEHGHGVLKTDLAGGTLPCGRFGASAAWWRINMLAHNLLQFLKLTVLPDELASCRPKALRFRLFRVAGWVVAHGRSLTLKLSAAFPLAEALVAARQALVGMALQDREGPSRAPT